MSAIALGPVGLAWAGLLVVGVLGFALATGVNLIKDGLVASARTTAQLLGVGLILNPVFARESWLLIVLVLGVMTLIAGWTGGRRVERALRGTGPALTLILLAVSSLTLAYVTQLVVGVDGPQPRYLIPLGGIVLGNAMTAGSLAAQRFHDDVREQRGRVEAALGLGATPAQATQAALARALRAALTPTINAMLIVGIVKLPGIMTGQMLGGADPFGAATYQIVILFMLLFSDGVTALLILRWLRRRAFNAAWQLRI
ncbi:MAG: iron export ABC transporter permease subunit FetB [Planctomycetes bacterium]|nr:iron export ABC transporter permease subunit FetB [Planctomycetota bacterium]